MLSGDDNLARQAITAFAASIQPDGIVCGRYPAHGIQIITGFALFWVLQVCDHMIHFDDKQFASEFLPTINSVLEWFERKTGNKGLVTNLPREYWSFIDWHGDWEGDEDFKDPGVPPAGRSDGTWSFMSMLYAYTLERVVTLCKQVGRPAQIDEYSSRAKRTIGAVKAHCFDGQAFTDSEASRKGPYSQQSQVWAVLSGCISGEDAKRLVIQAFIETNDFAVCSYPMMHYAFRALAEVDLYDQHFHALWEPWRAMLRNNLTTWEEDSVTMRSDCHEWSSLPIWEYTAEVAGLRPLEPGWSKLLFSPRLSLLPSLSASINLGKRGLAHVEWTTSQGGSMAVSIKLPENLHLISQLPDGREVDHGVCPGVQLEFNAGGQ
ncbi:hypothetical protein IAR55_005587 [Kwoniella newhampshirensis]|uniref:Alpha-L-rhamnosidase C-terminal domain-containing protein n=1 Tax=Kwoniella newhampshirensis TaxID=1651941 RepID=A0AAW0YZE5_9TREE